MDYKINNHQLTSEGPAYSMADGFLRLQKDVQSFQLEWSAIVKKYNLASVSTTGQEWQTVHVSELSVTLQSALESILFVR
ncbi:hypothetical protein K474DRAFT_1666395, partial [Panus rudis PR-1116 ss-1]